MDFAEPGNRSATGGIPSNMYREFVQIKKYKEN